MVFNDLVLGLLMIVFATLAAIFFLNTRRGLTTGIGRIKTVVCVRRGHPIGFWSVTALSGCLCLFSACVAGLIAYALMAA